MALSLVLQEGAVLVGRSVNLYQAARLVGRGGIRRVFYVDGASSIARILQVCGIHYSANFGTVTLRGGRYVRSCVGEPGFSVARLLARARWHLSQM